MKTPPWGGVFLRLPHRQRLMEVIMVHQYQLNGCNIVLDSCSGSIHVVDEVAYDIIALFESSKSEAKRS